MVKILLRVVINAVAFFAASLIVGGMSLEGGPLEVLLLAAIFGLINATIKPIVKLFSLPLIVLTLGLFTFIINTLLLLFLAWISNLLDIGGLSFDGFFPALFASIIISLVSWALNLFLE